MKFKLLLLVVLLVNLAGTVSAQKAYFIDGYHGGVYGGYPDNFTRFMVDMLNKHPDWRINIEIEPETWDKAKLVDPAAYNEFKALAADQSANGRIEFINPAYAQSYLYNISGESIIRQFSYGIKKIKMHFPDAVFSTYSTEEPCFTSALPQILRSFGYKYASLKNPNTCFGGYAAAHGGELVTWIGPDGTGITTAPRYGVEKLSTKSTWQTIGWENSPAFVNASYADGIKHPIGMTIQDAGWKGGPFMGIGARFGITTTYTTWRNYFENVTAGDAKPQWKPTQEDMLVNLVWGSQVMQKIAQEVRVAENKIISAEKMASLAKIYNDTTYPADSLDAAWRTLLLSQHHDSWIVPYNGKPGNTWADKILLWTNNTISKSDSIIASSANAFAGSKNNETYVRVYNTVGAKRNEMVAATVPAELAGASLKVIDANGQEVVSQVNEDNGVKKIMFKADVPSIGYSTYKLLPGKSTVTKGATIKQLPNGLYQVETDLYTILIDPKKGGIIKSLIAKKLNNREFVDKANPKGFNELRGNFYNDGGFRSSEENPAMIEILQQGPLMIKLAIKGTIANNQFIQLLTVKLGEERIDLSVNIDWKGNPGIGEPTPAGTYKWQNPNKAFYDDRFKMLALFPLNLPNQKVYKDAPFDVTESKLENTFYNSWDSIKNNVILHWVDVTDGAGKYGMTMLTDHTTSYTHGKDFPLGLDLQYSGMGLWGRDYKINGPSAISYALIPHAGKWDKSGTWTATTKWAEPLITTVSQSAAKNKSASFISINKPGIEISSMVFDGDDLSVRLYNAEGDTSLKIISFSAQVRKAEFVELNGTKRSDVKITKIGDKTLINLTIPRFGFRTIKLSGINIISKR
ncbi:glycosyl hydrolase [Mucilaginibacter sp. BJC16-A38]|uniref:glycoside hydrolase family 38 C-terminal domain-containing protein n=1 Tax=Mucilaginibacter phenanthrenivorans TaxID=1234842 RepID=UPI002158568F|nr:glycoside hydrolase family 38 C-terminal domain-containing protein [Mucilaginibacter phenanthrenivorans]MCR8559559.1 glycosyl hydrolase [Mucilaginibacter phenanthrenivorans]